MSEPLTIGRVMEQALAAYEELGALAETVEDEWTYITDLASAWRERIAGFVVARGAEPAALSEQAAVERAVDEIERIRDPHRAIDWLSTFPQVVLTAFGERP
jgi:hypothetical protein